MRWSFVSLVFALGSAGCSKSLPAGTCNRNGDCTGGSVCVESECLVLCQTQRDCFGTTWCNGTGTCVDVTSDTPPVLQTVIGDNDEDPTAIREGLIVQGQQLADAAFELQTDTTVVGLTVVSQQDTRALLAFPADIVSGAYTLTATNGAGSSQAAVTLTLPELGADDLLARINTATGLVSINRLPVGTDAGSVASGAHAHDSIYYPRAQVDALVASTHTADVVVTGSLRVDGGFSPRRPSGAATSQTGCSGAGCDAHLVCPAGQRVVWAESSVWDLKSELTGQAMQNCWNGSAVDASLWTANYAARPDCLGQTQCAETRGSSNPQCVRIWCQ